MEADEALLRICASVWLCMLQARSSRRSSGLLESLGGLPWSFPWGTLWHGSVIYVCAPMSPQCSSFGPLAYVGEADNFARRISEHSCRLLSPTGSVQQPFFHFVRGDEKSSHLMRLSMCEWIFFPVAHEPGDSSARKVLEMEWIQRLGALNPPKVHRLLRHFHAKRTFPSIRLFGCRRSLCRLRDKTPGRSQRRHENKAAQEAWKLGLQKIVAALAGHCFPGCGPSSVAAWRLSRAAWV